MNAKLPIGCSGEGLATRTGNEEIFRLLREAGYQSVDFWLYLYSLEPEHPMLQDNWRAWVDSIAALYRDNALIAAQIHGILNTYIPDDFHFEAPSVASYRNLEAARMLGCTRIVFHPAFYVGRVADADTRRRVIDYNIRWFGMLADTAKALDVKIQLENTFDFARVQQPGDMAWPFTTAQDIITLADALGDSFEVCLDTGHAHISAQDIPAMITQLGNRLKSIHLNDNFGPLPTPKQDLHMFLGCGTIDWKPVFDTLFAIGYDGVLNLEPTAAMARAPKPIWLSQLQTGARDLCTLAAESGFSAEVTV